MSDGLPKRDSLSIAVQPINKTDLDGDLLLNYQDIDMNDLTRGVDHSYVYNGRIPKYPNSTIGMVIIVMKASPIA